jgi:nitroreductase
VLHYTANDQTLAERDLLLIDAGAERAGYCADVTRTWPVGARFSPAQRDCYQAVLAAQLAAIGAAKPGATLDALHMIAVRVLAEALATIGLIEGSVDEIVEKETYRRFYMHRTSHWLGRDVHDGASQAWRHARALEPGMVFTVEPGLYIPPTRPTCRRVPRHRHPHRGRRPHDAVRRRGAVRCRAEADRGARNAPRRGPLIAATRHEETPMDLATVDHLLTTTRSVRKRLDFSRPVPPALVQECIDIALQAPTGSNAQGWSFVVVTDAAKRKALADLYRQAFQFYVDNPDFRASYEPQDLRAKQMPRILDSATYLAEHLHEAPVHVPCIQGRVEQAGVIGQASVYGSILPAAWSFMLAARSRGLGSGVDDAASHLSEQGRRQAARHPGRRHADGAPACRVFHRQGLQAGEPRRSAQRHALGRLGLAPPIASWRSVSSCRPTIRTSRSSRSTGRRRRTRSTRRRSARWRTRGAASATTTAFAAPC